jgi:hypothetical protein
MKYLASSSFETAFTAMITFDTSVQKLACLVQQHGLNVADSEGVFIRDMRGRLVFLARRELEDAIMAKINGAVSADLKPYISPIGAVADRRTPGTARALEATERILLRIQPDGAGEGICVAILDRRSTGIDWIHAPEDLAIETPRLVFSSLKGGVGRSTALSVLAAELAGRGRSVLVIDLDLEAPGLGSMLVEPDATPKFGSLDFYVEDGLRAVDDSFLQDAVGASWLGAGRGRVDVVPSYGAITLNNPREVIAKLSRAYLEGEDEKGEPRSFLSRTQCLVSRLAKIRRYDAILIDARSGLHETTAASILGLGADVLLFGVNQPQTFLGYRILLSNLARLPVNDPERDWRYRLRMMQAKSESSENVATYRSRMFDLFDNCFYSKVSDAGDPIEQGFRFGIDDNEAPHFAIPILEDERYRLFDPVLNKEQLGKDLYEGSFAPFLAFCIERLQLEEEPSI